MSCGEHNEMEENVKKKAETSAVPQPFKQRRIITHLQAKQNSFGKAITST